MGLIPHNAPSIPGTPSSIPGTPANVPSYGEIRAPSSVQLRDMKGRFVTGGFGYEWQNLQELMDMPEDFGGHLLEATRAHLQKLAETIQQYAQANAPWQDRTGDARAGLKAVFIDRGTVFEIDLGHSVPYGFFLENYNGGQYAVIQPTLRNFSGDMAAIADEYRAKAGGGTGRGPFAGGGFR